MGLYRIQSQVSVNYSYILICVWIKTLNITFYVITFTILSSLVSIPLYLHRYFVTGIIVTQLSTPIVRVNFHFPSTLLLILLFTFIIFVIHLCFNFSYQIIRYYLICITDLQSPNLLININWPHRCKLVSH